MTRSEHETLPRPAPKPSLRLWLFDFIFLGQHNGHLAPIATVVASLCVLAFSGPDAGLVKFLSVVTALIGLCWMGVQRAGVLRFKTLLQHDVSQCAECGYDLSHAPAGTCPECGHTLASLRNEVREAYGSARRE